MNASRPPPRAVAILVTGVTLLVAAPGARAFDGDRPVAEGLRHTIREVRERQTLRPPADLERRVAVALGSIERVWGAADPRTAGSLATRLREAWTELEQARALRELGYAGFDDASFRTADAAFADVVQDFNGRTVYAAGTGAAALMALGEVSDLSRAARRAVVGLSSDDVAATRAKRQELLLREPDDDRATAQFIGLELRPAR